MSRAVPSKAYALPPPLHRVLVVETALRKIACSRGPLYFDPQEPGPETEALIYFVIDLARGALRE